MKEFGPPGGHSSLPHPLDPPLLLPPYTPNFSKMLYSVENVNYYWTEIIMNNSISILKWYKNTDT